MVKAAASFFCMLLLGCASRLHAQYYFYNDRFYDAPVTFDLGLSAGGMNGLTDLGGRMETGSRFLHDLNWNTTRASGGLFAGVDYHNRVTFRLELAVGSVSAADSLLRKYVSPRNGRYLRNLSFHSSIREWSLLLGVHPFGWVPDLQLIADPYLLAGVGSFHFDPAVTLQGASVSLPQLHTEGEGFKEYPDRPPYRLTQWNLPLGAGIRCAQGPRASLRMELVYRILFTDYLDDVSTGYIPPVLFSRNLSPPLAALALRLADQRTGPSGPDSRSAVRGNPGHNDSYFSVQVKWSLVLGRKKI